MHGRVGDPWRGIRGNLLLRSLAPQDAVVMRKCLKRVVHRRGDTLSVGEAATAGRGSFSETLVVRLAGTGSDSCIGLVGLEGAVCWESLFGASLCGQRAKVEMGGSALAMSCDRLRAATAASPTLAASLVRFTQTLTIQMGRTIVSNLNDSMEARISGWLLMLHDRIEGDEVRITHRSLAALLNVRRASVTDALHLIEGERALHCTRGRIVIRNRALLQSLAGSAYGLTEAAYRSAIGPFGKPAAVENGPMAAAN